MVPDAVNIADILDLSVSSSQADHSALSNGRDSLSYAQLAAKISAVAGWIQQQGVQLVAIHADNSIDWVVLDLACQEAAIKCLPLPDFFSLSQLEHCIRQSRVDLLFTKSHALCAHLDLAGLKTTPAAAPLAINAFAIKHASEAQPSDRKFPDGTQKITFTSGSTGTPKGVCLSASHQWQTANAVARAIHVEHPRHLCLLPLATLLENVAGVYAPLLRKGTVIVPNNHERGLNGSSGLDVATFLQCISKYQPDTIILLPQLLGVLVTACEQGWQPPATLKFIAVGGARVAPDLLIAAHQLDLPVYEGYGLSECGSVVTLNTPASSKPGYAGQSLDHCAVNIVEHEIVISGAVFLGYMDDVNSWYPKTVYSGDLGELQGGFLAVNGRKKNLIISSYGRNISPEWVESELAVEPFLGRCVVVGDGRPHLAALLSASDEVPDAAIDAWVSQVNARLPDYAQVYAWVRLDNNDWQGCFTANGRPQRQKINTALAAIIDALYQRSNRRYAGMRTSTPSLETIQR